MPNHLPTELTEKGKKQKILELFDAVKGEGEDSVFDFNVRDGSFDYKLFALICAVRSYIGKTAQFRRMTKAQIRHRMNGYKRQDIMDAMKPTELFPAIRDGDILEEATTEFIELSDKQIERLRDKAAELNFFRFYTYKRRQTFYSTRLSDEELIKAVYTSKDYVLNKKSKALELELQEKRKQKGLKDQIDRNRKEIKLLGAG